MKPTKKTSRPLPMARINTRIRQDQQKFIKVIAKNTNSTEGEIFRGILDIAMLAEGKKLIKPSIIGSCGNAKK